MSIGRRTTNAILGASRRMVTSHPGLHAAARDWRRYGRVSLKVSRRRPGVVYVPILGMHRSGTSCVTNLLAANGLDLGTDLIDPGPHNPKGFGESSEAIAINNAALRRHGAHYLSPPPYVTRFAAGLRRRAERFLVGLGGSPIVGWKDPRTTVTWPAWHELLSKSRYQVVACFRHPLGVCRSLQRIYGDLSERDALDVWLTYNRRLVALEGPVEWVHFDSPLEVQIRRICDRVGLDVDETSFGHFDRRLVHAAPGDATTGDDEIDSIYQCLLARWRDQEALGDSSASRRDEAAVPSADSPAK